MKVVRKYLGKRLWWVERIHHVRDFYLSLRRLKKTLPLRFVLTIDPRSRLTQAFTKLKTSSSFFFFCFVCSPIVFQRLHFQFDENSLSFLEPSLITNPLKFLKKKIYIYKHAKAFNRSRS